MILRVRNEHPECCLTAEPRLEGDDALGSQVGAGGEVGLFMDDKRLVRQTDRIVSLYNCQERLQDVDVSVHWMWRLPDEEGETSRGVGDLVVHPEVLMCGEEDGGDLETPGADRPPHSVSLTVQTSQYKIPCRERRERRDQYNMTQTQY